MGSRKGGALRLDIWESFCAGSRNAQYATHSLVRGKIRPQTGGCENLRPMRRRTALSASARKVRRVRMSRARKLKFSATMAQSGGSRAASPWGTKRGC
jgi:hypothetical protein